MVCIFGEEIVEKDSFDYETYGASVIVNDNRLKKKHFLII